MAKAPDDDASNAAAIEAREQLFEVLRRLHAQLPPFSSVFDDDGSSADIRCHNSRSAASASTNELKRLSQGASFFDWTPSPGQTCGASIVTFVAVKRSAADHISPFRQHTDTADDPVRAALRGGPGPR